MMFMLAIVVFLITLSARLFVELGMVQILLRRPSLRPDRRMVVMAVSNVLTFPITFAVVMLCIERESSFLLVTPCFELAWAVLKAIVLARASGETAQSVYTACFATAVSCVVGVCVAPLAYAIALKIVV